jgi:hypothetical protein
MREFYRLNNVSLEILHELIEKSLPGTKALVDLLNRARPIIEQAEKLYIEAEPLIDKAKKEWETVGPAAQISIDVISPCQPGQFPGKSR